jgi:hypothetical protein
MTALLTALCITLGVAVTVLFIAWGRAERRAAKAETARDRAEAQLAERRQAEARMAAHWQTVPREQPTLQFPTFTRPQADAPTGPRRRAAHRIDRVDTRKDHNQR